MTFLVVLLLLLLFEAVGLDLLAPTRHDRLSASSEDEKKELERSIAAIYKLSLA